MRGWIVLLIVLAVLWLIGRVRLGGWVQYDETGLTARAIAGPLKLTLFPKKELTEEEKAKKRARDRVKKAKAEEKKAKADAKKAAREAKWREKHPGQEPEQKKKGGALPPVLKLLPLVGEAAGGLKRRIRIDELTLRLTWAAEDAAEAALGFGRANAVMGMLWPLIDHNFEVKKSDLDVSVDFQQTGPVVFCRAALTIRIGQVVSFVLRLAVLFLRILIEHKSEQQHSTKKQEA